MQPPDLTPDQVRRLVDGMAPHVIYFNQLVKRMDRAREAIPEPVYVRAIAARNATETLLTWAQDIGKLQAGPPTHAADLGRK